MNSAEKPYEQLSSSERDIFNICGEIIAYKRGVGDVELLKLRERATNLFARMREVDLSEHDSYFKLIAEANELKGEFEIIKKQLKEDKYISIDFKADSAEDIVDKLVGELTTSKSVRTLFEWFPADQDFDPFGDATVIDIVHQEASDEFKLQFTETLNHKRFTSAAHIKAFYEMSSLKNAKLHVHEHEGLDTTEFSLTISDLSQEQVRAKIKDFIEIIKRNPRM